MSCFSVKHRRSFVGSLNKTTTRRRSYARQALVLTETAAAQTRPAWCCVHRNNTFWRVHVDKKIAWITLAERRMARRAPKNAPSQTLQSPIRTQSYSKRSEQGREEEERDTTPTDKGGGGRSVLLVGELKLSNTEVGLKTALWDIDLKTERTNANLFTNYLCTSGRLGLPHRFGDTVRSMITYWYMILRSRKESS